MSDEVSADLSTGDGKSVPLLSFVSHIDGKNARVSVWPDRVEWDRKGILSTGAKAGMAVMTVGMSYLATGVTRKQSTEVIPVKSIMSVTTKRGLGLQTKVSVITSGNTIEMRISHKEAEQVRSVLMQLASGTHPSQTASTSAAPQAPAAPVAAPQPDVAAQLHQLASLRDAGILMSSPPRGRGRARVSASALVTISIRSTPMTEHTASNWSMVKTFFPVRARESWEGESPAAAATALWALPRRRIASLSRRPTC